MVYADIFSYYANAIDSFSVYSFVWNGFALAAAIGAFVIFDRITAPLQGVLFYAFSDGDISIIKGFRKSRRYRRGSFRRMVTFDLSSIGLTLISVLLLCIPLFFYTIPYLLCRYVYSMARAADDKIPTIDITDEIIETGDINNEQH